MDIARMPLTEAGLTPIGNDAEEKSRCLAACVGTEEREGGDAPRPGKKVKPVNGRSWTGISAPSPCSGTGAARFSR